MSNAIQLLANEITGARDAFMSALSDKSVNFEAEAGFAIQTLSKNEFSLKVALNNRQSVINAVTNVAAIGVSLNPAKKQAYLVPRDGGICLDISYIGLLDLAMDTGSIKWGQAKVVHENDIFVLNGLDKQPTHSFQPFGKDRGEIIGVYCTVKTADGDYLTEHMSVDDVNGIRDRSEAWKAYVAKKTRSCPWLTDWSEMAKKTCVKRAYKYWPKTDRLEKAINYLNTDGGEGLTQIQNAIPADWIDVEPLISAALRTTTDKAALDYWNTNKALLAKQPHDYAKFKQVVVDHRSALKKSADADAERTIEMPVKAVVDDDFVAALDKASGEYVPE